MSDRWNINIQYKGTEICLDFYCPAAGCDGEGHYDGFFGQVLTCPVCRRLWQLPNSIPVVEVTAATAIMTPVELNGSEE